MEMAKSADEPAIRRDSASVYIRKREPVLYKGDDFGHADLHAAVQQP